MSKLWSVIRRKESPSEVAIAYKDERIADVHFGLPRESSGITAEMMVLALNKFFSAPEVSMAPVPMLLACPTCGLRHIDEGEFATKEHHTHACQGCGMVWRPALVPTCGVQFLPGFKNEESSR